MEYPTHIPKMMVETFLFFKHHATASTASVVPSLSAIGFRFAIYNRSKIVMKFSQKINILIITLGNICSGVPASTRWPRCNRLRSHAFRSWDIREPSGTMSNAYLPVRIPDAMGDQIVVPAIEELIVEKMHNSIIWVHYISRPWKNLWNYDFTLCTMEIRACTDRGQIVRRAADTPLQNVCDEANCTVAADKRRMKHIHQIYPNQQTVDAVRNTLKIR